MNREDPGPAVVIDRDLTELARRLPEIAPDEDTFRQCRAIGRRKRRRRFVTASSIPMLLIAGAAIRASHYTSGSTAVVTPAPISSATPTTQFGQHLTKISRLELSDLPPGAMLFLSGNLHGTAWRSYVLPNAPADRLIVSASVGDGTDLGSFLVGLSGPGVVQTRIAVRGANAVLTRTPNLGRIDWLNVRQHVLYTITDSSGTLSNEALIKIADGVTAS